MASEVPKKMIKIHFEGSFSVSADWVWSWRRHKKRSDLFPFPDRSLFTVMYFIASFECQVSFPSSMPTGSERFAFLGRGFV